MRCHRYIELKPLRAAMVVYPGEYLWSSHRSNAYGEYDPLVSPHAGYLSLSSDPTERQRVYHALVMKMAGPDEVDAVRQHVQCQHAYESNRVRAEIETQLGRRAGPRKIGRPKKSDETQRNREKPLWP